MNTFSDDDFGEVNEPGLTLITGGAGFIGTNLADRLLSRGRNVVVFDNLARPGVGDNLRWLRERHPNGLRVEIGDIRDTAAVNAVTRVVSQFFHFAAQVAVTASLSDPIEDFEINARGTLNLLEALRGLDEPATLVFTSTNKVYGHLADVPLEAHATRYQPIAGAVSGLAEDCPINFHSPHGCSKGAADQYVLDYAHTFGLAATVFRTSCIYGPHQFGNEDQGWVAHFLLQALSGEPITIYGDGRQVRDVLFVEDLVEAFLLAERQPSAVSGKIFNIGGGPMNTTSLLELAALIGELIGEEPRIQYGSWRQADQRYYVSDTRRFTRATGWRPRVGVKEGVRRLNRWLLQNRVKAEPENGSAAPSSTVNLAETH